VKNAVGTILQTLIEKALARQPVCEYLARAGQMPAMEFGEIRRCMKRLTAARRSEIVNAIPNCAWKAREVIHLHKHLFLDYMTGEWVLATLVKNYNLETTNRLAGTFTFGGGLTIRGANAAIEGVLRKIADEPELIHRLR